MGYGRIRINGENIPAHRHMCGMAYGEPTGARNHSTHKCGNGPGGCVNPKHLEWGTRFKNQQDRVEHGTSNRGEQCAAHKLTTEQASAIFTRLRNGERAYLLAAEHGVSNVTILDIGTGRSWAWLTGLKNPKARDIDGALLSANDNTPASQEAAA
jgi:hypothetical protein